MTRHIVLATLTLFLFAVPARADQSEIRGDVAKKNVVQVAVGSKDHSTLVTAVKAAELVDVLSNPGPFTVFAPTNEAFTKLPPGTVEGLLKPESKEALQNILEYHVFVGVLKPDMLTDGRDLGHSNGDHAKISVKDGKVSINNAHVVASVPAANGIVHVIDTVLLPPEKK
jgi:uncharacterized surface protein with fasciclin (FAS1) repeats